MNVVCVIKKGHGATSVSSAARYISTRDRDEHREGAEARKLFSAGDDKLHYHQANRLLGDGQEPKADEVSMLSLVLRRKRTSTSSARMKNRNRLVFERQHAR